MKCPRDSAILQSLSVSEAEMHACKTCGGLFVPLNQKAVPILSFESLRPGERSRIPVAGETKIFSPESGKPMLVFHYRGVVIDYCPDSNAVWLDHGELEKIAGSPRTTQDRTRKALVKAGSSRNPVFDGIDAAFSGFDLVDFLGEAVSAIFSGW